MITDQTALLENATTAYLGLAPFLRLSIAGTDLRPIAMTLLEMAGRDEDNPCLWMNLSTAFLALGQRDMGLSIQEQALLLQRSFEIPASRQPARLRLLVLMVAGDLSENTPIDCLLEDGAVDLLYYYATADAPLPANIPPHDALLVAIADSEPGRAILKTLEEGLKGWPHPVINDPAHIPNTERSRASQLLQGIPGLVMPPTHRVSRSILEALAAESLTIEHLFAESSFPIILRPVGSQGGRDLAKIDGPQAIADYLAQVADGDFYLSRFVDYSGTDGLFRKYRIVQIAGQSYPSHMAISSHWMVHYVNAGMYDDAAKRAEESAFMRQFDQFVHQHQETLANIHAQIGLDYLCIDCAQTQDGRLLIFELDHVMVVHAMDSEALFPYKQTYMHQVRKAFEDYLDQRSRPGH